ncbi:MAG TPA: hypothetical protein PLY56_10275, partial [Armatimonadota bacterium]|nr:hypothetical protein [Armatimonadota bacterium]
QRFVETNAALESATTLADARRALALAQETARLLERARESGAPPDAASNSSSFSPSDNGQK